MLKNTIIKTTGLIIFDRSYNSTKGIANVSVNDEFLIKGIRIFEGANGPYVLMPSQLVDGEYNNLVFPITADMREQIQSSVIRTYNNMVTGELTKLPPVKLEPPSNSDTNIFVTLERHNGKIKATGKAIINRSIVISGIKVLDYTDASGREVKFIAMPSSASRDGVYRDVVQIVSKEFSQKLTDAVWEAYKKLQNTEFKGLPYSVLRKTGEVTKITSLGKSFVQKLTSELEEMGIAYSAVFDSIVQLFIRKEDEELFNAVRMKLTKRLVDS